MILLPSFDEMYHAVANSDSQFEGIFVVAVKTTRIFCRPGCKARTPLAKNVEFFSLPREAVFAGYRPCKLCRPLEVGSITPTWVRSAIELVESSADHKIRDRDLRSNNIEPSRVRRYFKQNFGMTFQAFARGRRLGEAFSQLRNGVKVIETAMDAGFESTSGFRDAFQRAFGFPPSMARGKTPVLLKWIDTPLGPMIAGATSEALVLLEFAERRMLPAQVTTLQKRLDCHFAPGSNKLLQQLETELSEYFRGERKEFSVPLSAPGSEFQESAWKELLAIPYGETRSYGEMAANIGKPDAQRAVGKANGDNRIAILIPCHRVIRSDGTLCGYGGGIWRKQRLLELESGQISLLE